VFTVVLCGVPIVAVTLAPASAAPFKVTLPLTPPDVITHVTVNVCPAVPAL
jgi:hypothetical protein